MAHSAVSPMAVSREPGFAGTSVKNEAPSSGVSWPAVLAGAFAAAALSLSLLALGTRIGRRYRYRRYRLADRHANHRCDDGWLFGGSIAHQMGQYSYRRSIFP